MILGSTIRVISRQCPGYRIVPPGIARKSVSVCVCRSCANCIIGKDHRCGNLVGRLDPSEEGHAIVAWNGSCDRAVWRKSDGEFKLEAEG